jgi:hypothetical protein
MTPLSIFTTVEAIAPRGVWFLSLDQCPSTSNTIAVLQSPTAGRYVVDEIVDLETPHSSRFRRSEDTPRAVTDMLNTAPLSGCRRIKIGVDGDSALESEGEEMSLAMSIDGTLASVPQPERRD